MAEMAPLFEKERKEIWKQPKVKGYVNLLNGIHPPDIRQGLHSFVLNIRRSQSCQLEPRLQSLELG